MTPYPTTWQLLPADFFMRTDVVQIARELIGKILITQWAAGVTAVRITETEAYRAPDDRACHAFGNRRTARTEVMFGEGGYAYIYLCYGLHHLFNVVTGPSNVAHAVLIRAGEPLVGLDIMRSRRRRTHVQKMLDVALTTGPGALAQALGLLKQYTGQPLCLPDSTIRICDDGCTLETTQVACGPRIGVDYAGECAAWPWRFWRANSRYVSKMAKPAASTQL